VKDDAGTIINRQSVWDRGRGGIAHDQSKVT
jgi:hypothetical protein